MFYVPVNNFQACRDISWSALLKDKTQYFCWKINFWDNMYTFEENNNKSSLIERLFSNILWAFHKKGIFVATRRVLQTHYRIKSALFNTNAEVTKILFNNEIQS